MRTFKALVLMSIVAAVAPAQDRLGFKVVVNPRNSAEQVERSFLADIFLKKVSRWPDGTVAKPVDQHPETPTRQKLTQDVLNRSVASVKNYWEQMIFSGRGIPPVELSSDEEVLQYVLKHSGAVGYVSSGTDTRTVKVLAVR